MTQKIPSIVKDHLSAAGLATYLVALTNSGAVKACEKTSESISWRKSSIVYSCMSTSFEALGLEE